MRGRGTARAGALLALGFTGIAIAGCSSDESGDARGSVDSAESSQSAAAAELGSELDDAFRIDLTSIDVGYDWYPEEDRVDGAAELRFSMRDGEDTPIFHFNPLRGSRADEREMLTGLLLDGEPLDPADEGDLRMVRTAPGAERAYEVRRAIDDGSEHTLEVEWSMPKPAPPRAGRPWFFQTFDDTQGPDDEIDSPFPTINSPEELASHAIDLRVHSREPYVALGSGSTEEVDSGSPDVQEWTIDTGDAQQISSSTMFFAAVPESKVAVDTFSADDVEVEIVTNRPEDLERAEEISRESIATLVEDFGEFPNDKVSILLTRWGSGMEYYGAFRTGLGALEHEMGHMYFGTTLVNRTWRDTWWDEAAVQWWQGHDRKEPVPDDFERPFGDDRPAAEPGFDTAAYGSGAKVMEAVAQELGGDEQMMELLTRMSAEMRFEPFSTEDFIDEVVAFDDSVDRSKLERWMLGS